jgi:hypothetical protein
MRPYRDFGNLLFARINFGWLGYVTFTAAELFLFLSFLEPLINRAVGGGFRSGNPAAGAMPLSHWIGAGLVVWLYLMGAVYAGCVERKGRLFMDLAAIRATLNVASATRGVGLFVLPLVAMIAVSVGLFSCGVPGDALPIVAVGAVLSNWLCFRAVAWLRLLL